MCNIESPSSCKEGVDTVGEYFINKAKEMGWDVEVSKQDVSGNSVAITMNKDAQLAPIVLSGHIDTVHPIGLFGYPPVRREGNILYGPGVCDCKGGAVAADMTVCGIPTVDSIGVYGGRIHSKDEFAYVDSLAASAKMQAAVVYYFE